MRIRSLVLHNWLCYRGEHTLELGPKVYAIVAHHLHDAERSNWLGKTSLPEAVRFALYGTHRHRTEDEWITHGEKEGRVEIHFDDGSMVKRSRKRGKATQLYFQGAMGKEAQESLLRRVGLALEDFEVTCYFEQRAMARLILARPEERMGVVSSWFRLDPLERAEDVLRSKAAELSFHAETLGRNIRVAQEIEQQELGGQELDVVTAEEETLAEAHADAQAKVADITDLYARTQRLAAVQARAEQYDELVSEGKTLRKEIDALDEELIQDTLQRAMNEETAVATKLNAATEDLGKKRLLARGQFDGQCPVAEMECPVKDKINKDRARGKALADAAAKTVVELQREHDHAAKVEADAQNDARHLLRKKERIEELRRRVLVLAEDKKTLEKIGEIPDVESLRARMVEANGMLADTGAKLNAIRRSIGRIAQSRQEQTKLGLELAEVEKKLATYREALLLFGKNGAQRRVAEVALTEIERGANTMLEECGIELTVKMPWSREGKGLAKSCDACGHPYPDSARVKKCERCGSDRGPLLVNRLTIDLSNRSGAAEDLAGAAIQLAASAWLRAERMSAWSTALLDEPFGMLDAAHRKTFAAHLVKMLGGYGFNQAFVIAHHASVLDALPGRIEITSDGVHAKAKVIS